MQTTLCSFVTMFRVPLFQDFSGNWARFQRCGIGKFDARSGEL